MAITIAIPSKENTKLSTLHILENIADIEIFIFVEPQEAKKYKQIYKKIIVLKKNNMGLAYSRNQILDYFRNKNKKYLFMIDDDIEGFIKKTEKKSIEITNNKSELLLMFRELIFLLNFYYYIGLLYGKEFFNHEQKIIKEKHWIWCFAGYNLEKLGNIKYDENLKIQEDMDFLAQIIKYKIPTAVFTKYAFITKINRGIISTWRNQKNYFETYKYLAKKWGMQNVYCIKKENLYEPRIRWRNL